MNVLAEAPFDNIDVYCEDIPRMLHFYRDVLGLQLLYPHAEGSDWFAIQAGAVSVYFLRSGTPGKDVHPPQGDARGIASFSFAVENLDDAIRSLDGQVDWSGEVDRWSHPSGTWYQYRFFRDPEGNNLSITEPHKTTATAPSLAESEA